jgi:hypothetical protein
MLFNDLFETKTEKDEFNWNELSEELSVEQRITIAENYFSNNKLLESDDHAIKYFDSLKSDPLKKNKKYIVVPLMLIQNTVHKLNTDLLHLTFISKTSDQIVFVDDAGQEKKYPETKTDKGIYKTFAFDKKASYDNFRSKLNLKFNTVLPDTNLIKESREPYQQAIDKLEVAHINNLNAKMDAIIGRVNREKLTPEHKQALKKEYIRLKAERDSIYGIKDGTPEFTVECDAEGNASVIDRIGQAIAQFTAKKYGSTAFDAATAYAGTTFKNADINDIAGWKNAAARKTGPVRLRPVVKQKPQSAEVVVSEWRNTAPGADEEQRKLKKVGIVRRTAQVDEMDKSAEQPGRDGHVSNKTYGSRDNDKSSGKESQGKPTTAKQAAKDALATLNKQELDEGWSDAIVSQRTGSPRTPYSVYIKGKKWKDFETDDHAEAVADKLRAKFRADGRDPSVITVAPTDYDKGIEEGIGDTVRKATKYAMGGMRVNNAIRKHERKHDAAMKANDYDTAKKEIRHVNRLDNKYNPVDDPMEEEWSQKYKSSINCSNPKGFSQKAHCASKNEDTMDQAADNPSGAKFGGYYRGTQVGAPRPGQSFGAESKEMDEAISKKDLISKLQKDLPKVTDPKNKNAKPVKWTGPKSDEDYGYTGYQGHGMSADKKKGVTEGMNFMEWAVSQGSRFNNFATNPEVYSQARTAYLNEDIYGGIPKIAKVPTGAMYSNAKLPTLKTNLRKAKEQKVRTAKALNRSLTEDEMLDEDLASLFGEAQNIYAIYQFLKANAVPVALFVAAVITYGLHTTLSTAKDDESKFMKMAKDAWNRVDQGRVEKIVDWLNNKFIATSQKMKIGDPLASAMDFAEEKQKGVDGKVCWDGYKRMGTKQKGGKTVDNCVKMEDQDVSEDWQKANKKDKTAGMSKKAVKAYRRENPGSKLKTAVTTKPSKLKKGSKDSKRRKSYCARSAGQKKMHNIDCSKTPDKAICAARRRWNCESQEQFDAMLREAVEQASLKPGQYYVWAVHFDDGTDSKVKVTSDQFDPKAYYAKKNKVVIKTDYDWTIHG